MAQDIGQVVLEGLPSLYTAAQRGDSHAATVAVRRILTRLRDADPELAEELKRRLLPSQVVGSPLRRATGPLSPTTNTNSDEPRDRETHGELLKIVRPTGVRPIVHPEVSAQLDRLLLEHRNPETLACVGLAPRRTVLLVGPPGVGKTMAAGWLAEALSAPLYQLETSTLISSYLGRTGQNLRDVFDFGRNNEGVILLDEFDAIAKRRDDATDLGEMRRTVSVLLKEIEEWPGPSLLVAATNHPELLDPAILRRFQVTVTVALPTLKEAGKILDLHMAPLQCSRPVRELAAEMLAGVSGSNIRDLAQDVRRSVALKEIDNADEALLRILALRARTQSERRRLTVAARSILGWSFSALAEWLNLSKATIHNYLKTV